MRETMRRAAGLELDPLGWSPPGTGLGRTVVPILLLSLRVEGHDPGRRVSGFNDLRVGSASRGGRD